MLIEGLTQLVTAYFTRFHYLAPFVVLLLCGIGLPLPEEVTLLGCGILVHQGEVHFWSITGVCSAAILLGDSIPFWLGRHYGMRALEHRLVRRVLHPERFAKMERRFEEHGAWWTFACRFVAGVRIPGYFVAGTMRMSYPKFLLLDALGVAISVPVSIWLGRVFGGEVAKLQRMNKDFHLLLLFLVLALITVVITMARSKRAGVPPVEPRDQEPRAEG